MRENHDIHQRSSAPAEHTEIRHYLPGMPTPSSEPGRVESFLARLFRARGTLRPVFRRNSR
jgi:hypothetical protein